MGSSNNHLAMMSHSTLLTLEDVRCFQGVQQGQLRPITLLVGENSTGKTTFLGCLSTVHRLLQTPLYGRPEPDFNEDPFLMGSFREIVRARQGPSGKIREFKIGLGFSDAQGQDRKVTLGFGARHSQPSINSICWTFGNESFRVHEIEEGKTFISNGSLEYEFDAAIGDAMPWRGGHSR